MIVRLLQGTGFLRLCATLIALASIVIAWLGGGA